MNRTQETKGDHQHRKRHPPIPAAFAAAAATASATPATICVLVRDRRLEWRAATASHAATATSAFVSCSATTRPCNLFGGRDELVRAQLGGGSTALGVAAVRGRFPRDRVATISAGTTAWSSRRGRPPFLRSCPGGRMTCSLCSCCRQRLIHPQSLGTTTSTSW